MRWAAPASLLCAAMGVLPVAAALRPAAMQMAEGGPVRMTGAWQDDQNFSGVAVAGSHVLLASDEVSFLQLGRATSGPDGSLTIDRRGTIPLAGDLDTEVDVEALASSGGVVYGVGSHSPTRQRSDDGGRSYAANRDRLTGRVQPNPERDVLFRFRFDAETGTASPRETVSVLAVIRAHAVLQPFVGLAGKENGIDIEGLTTIGDALLVGFRGPVLRHGFAPVLRMRFDAPDTGYLLFVPLDGRGVRDLATVADGILVLAGPTGDSDQSHRLYRWNGLDCVPGSGGAGGRLDYLGDVPAAPGGKAEAMAVLDESADTYVVLFFYDSRPNGEPRRFIVRRAAEVPTDATRLCGRETTGTLQEELR
jgi:hypothetical protein